jgi:drug/metabolite transporter (DMT)-like permease
MDQHESIVQCPISTVSLFMTPSLPTQLSATRTRYWVGAACVLVAAFCFALKGVLIKVGYRYGVDTIDLLTLRMLFALPFYVGTLWVLSRRLPPVQLPARQWAMVALIGITGYYAASYFNFLGLVYINASLERILLFCYPTFVLLMNIGVVGRRVSGLQWLALALTYAGILMAFVPHLQSGGSQRNVWLGAFWVILSGLVYALYLVGSDSLIARLGSQRYTCYAMIAATVPTVLHNALENGLHLAHFPLPVYGLAILMALLNTVIPTFLMAEGIKRVGSSNTSIIGSIGPIFTIFLATSVLGEKITFWQIVGTLVVLTGVFLIGWKGRK